MQSSTSVGMQWCSDGQLLPGQWYVSHAVCHIACIDLRKSIIFWIQELILCCISEREKREEKKKKYYLGILSETFVLQYKDLVVRLYKSLDNVQVFWILNTCSDLPFSLIKGILDSSIRVL